MIHKVVEQLVRERAPRCKVSLTPHGVAVSGPRPFLVTGALATPYRYWGELTYGDECALWADWPALELLVADRVEGITGPRRCPSCSGRGTHRAAIDGEFYCPDHFLEVARYDTVTQPYYRLCGVCGKQGEVDTAGVDAHTQRVQFYGDVRVTGPWIHSACAEHHECRQCGEYTARATAGTYLCARCCRG